MEATQQHYSATDIRRVTVEIHQSKLTTIRWSDTADVTVTGPGMALEERDGELRIVQEGDVAVDSDNVFEVNESGVSFSWGSGGEITIGPSGVNISRRGRRQTTSARDNWHAEPGNADRHTIEITVPATIPTLSAAVHFGDLHLERPRGQVEVRVRSGDVQLREGEGVIDLSVGNGDTTVERFVGPLTLHSGSGDNLLRAVDGSVTIRAGSGDVAVRDGAGGLSVTGGSGDVRILDWHADRATLMTGSGDVSIAGGTLGYSQIQTGAGDVRCTTTLGVGTHEFTAASGDLSIGIPRNLSARIEAATTRGAIDAEMPLVAVGQRGPRSSLGRRVVGSIGEDPERAQITLRTAQGDIHLHWLDLPTGSRLATAEPAPQEPSPPATTPETAQVAPTEPASAPSDSERLTILEALANGALSVGEAQFLLDRLAERDQSGTVGEP